MSSICVQTFKDLAIPFSTLPFGDKNDYILAQQTCHLWIKTAASTAIAAGFFFADFVILKGSDYALDCIANIFDLNDSSIYPLKLIFTNGFLYIVPMLYSRLDSHATILCCFAENIYYGYRSYKARNYFFLGVNALFAAKQLKPRRNADPVHHWGSWRRPIRHFAKSWAPTMPTWYGYQEAHV